MHQSQVEFRFQLTDADGHTATYSPVPGRHPAPSFFWSAASVSTPPTQYVLLEARLSAAAGELGSPKPVTTFGVESMSIAFDGRSYLRFRDAELAPPWYRRGLERGRSSSEDVVRVGRFPASIHVIATVTLHLGGCGDAGPERTVWTTMVGRVSLLAMLAGEPVVLRSSRPFGDEVLELTMDFTASGPYLDYVP